MKPVPFSGHASSSTQAGPEAGSPPGRAASRATNREEAARRENGPTRASFWRRLLDLFRGKRHRKEINLFPPAKVYAAGRHEVKTGHHKVADRDRHGRMRGSRDK